MQSVHYLIFDVKSFVDAPLAERLQFSGEESSAASPAKTASKSKAKTKKKPDLDFVPYTLQIPSAVVLAKVSETYELLDIAALSEVRMQPEEIVERFWLGWERYDRPVLVTFNGRESALPLLELSAFRYGLAIPGWFSPVAKNYEWPRNRFNHSVHIDLMDVFTSFGTTRFVGGLDLAVSLLGRSGWRKTPDQTIWKMHEAGEFQEIENACVGDVLSAYFVFLRTRVLAGLLSSAGEKKLVAAARQWLEERAEATPAFAQYLETWEK
ncbi:MAG: 3'-5' exonuclease [Thermoguttaceae bacterium]|nr:3'-5' exonuclease [Thermoguttaceae bacterium]